MKSLLLIFFSVLFLAGCSKTVITDPSSNESGGVLFKIDKTTIPSNVSTITLKLSRSGYSDIIRNMNILTDSTAEITIESIPVGGWHLKVDAKDNNNVITYTGETDVTIQEGILLQVNLTLNPVSTGVGSIHIFVNWGNSSQWIDYIHNPVLNRNYHPTSPGSIKSGAVLYDNGIYKMWYYCVYSGGVANIWYAESPDGINWNVGNAPVLDRGSYGKWDAFSVWVSAVIKENNTYKMFYGGYTSSYSEVPKMGIAVSTDGIHWEKNPNPVFTGTGEYLYAYVTSVIKKDNTYYAFIDYRNGYNAISKIGYISSPDGSTWSFHPLFESIYPWEGGGVHFPSVIYDGTKFHMVYSDNIETALGYAESSDGINWERQATPILTSSTTYNHWINICYPQLIKTNTQFKVFYTGEKLPQEDGICLLTKNF